MSSQDLERGRDLEAGVRRLLDDDQRCGRKLLAEIAATVRLWAEDSGDKRFARIRRQLGQLDQHLRQLRQTALRQLEEIGVLLESLGPHLRDSRLASVLTAFADASTSELAEQADRTLGALLEVTGAERGFLLLADPESSGSAVFVARAFATDQLATSEYALSRTVLGRLFDRAEPILLADASASDFGGVPSVHALRLRSVLVTPLMAEAQRPVGALYLDDRRRARAFDRDDLLLCDRVAAVLAAWLAWTGLPAKVLARAEKVYLDAGLAGTEIIGRHPSIRQLRQQISQILDTRASVLIEGESGTGKELVARALHYEGKRRDLPFVALSCTALPEGLLESELFGHEKGAFTHAHRRRIGRLEQARGGTLFLDEVQSMDLALQAKFLRVLESRETQRLGGEETIRLDFRLVSAASCDLRHEISEGRFLEALYYRLNIVPLQVPPLRDRRADVRLLSEHFLTRMNRAYGKAVRLAPPVHLWLGQYDWPGNVRQLRNLIERLVVLAQNSVVETQDLPQEMLGSDEVVDQKDRHPIPSLHSLLDGCSSLQDLEQTLGSLRSEARCALIERTLEETGGNLSATARRLGIHRSTLHRWLKT